MKTDTQWLLDMIEAIQAIESYGIISYEAFLEDGKTQDAVMFNLIIMGEAAHQVTITLQEEHPEIPWSSIIGTRNVIVHGYDQIKLPIIWDIMTNNLHPLKRILQKLVQQ